MTSHGTERYSPLKYARIMRSIAMRLPHTSPRGPRFPFAFLRAASTRRWASSGLSLYRSARFRYALTCLFASALEMPRRLLVSEDPSPFVRGVLDRADLAPGAFRVPVTAFLVARLEVLPVV